MGPGVLQVDRFEQTQRSLGINATNLISLNVVTVFCGLQATVNGAALGDGLEEVPENLLIVPHLFYICFTGI
jgi:hypothetical protein